MAKSAKKKTATVTTQEIEPASETVITKTTISAPTRAEAVKISAARLEAAKASARWGELFNKSKKLKPEAYSLKSSYDPESPILHKQLGWGYILSKKNDRLEVLFQDGIKYLISNYK